jgi:outer membrane protein OmpA-like peptidoglycan-associated protein
MRRLRRSSVAGIALLASVSMSAAPETHRNFVACPIVRDTSTVPCWLAEYKGETYFLTLQTDVSAPVNPPQLGHQVLVEGVVSNEPRVCGGLVLKPVVLSVLPELDSSCSTVLPAEDRYNLTFEPPRPPGPSKGRLAFDAGPPAPRPAPEPDVASKTFALQFDFDSAIAFRHAGQLQQIQEFALKSKATRIEITAYRAASLLSNDTVFTEREDIGRRRAEQLASLLKDAGLTNVAYDVRWREAGPPDGVNDAALRRADIVVRRE